MANKEFTDVPALGAAPASDDLILLYDTSTGIVKSVTSAYLSAGIVSDTAYGASWDGVTTIAPSKNAVRDKIETMGDVTAAANLTANTVVVGDDGAKGVKSASAAVTIPTINLTGGQIAFPATAVPSADPNTLDDYEEGTWTPVPADASTGGNTGSAATATGKYTKIGDVVLSEVVLTNINTTGLTAGNDFYIQGLPFTPSGNFSGAVRAQNITFTGYLTFICSASALGIRESASGDGGDLVIVSEIGDDTGDFNGSIVYKI